MAQDVMVALAQEIEQLHVAEPSSAAPGAPYAIEGCEADVARPATGLAYLDALFGGSYTDTTGALADAPPAECAPTAVTIPGGPDVE
jgi:hypothetical protein